METVFHFAMVLGSLGVIGPAAVLGLFLGPVLDDGGRTLRLLIGIFSVGVAILVLGGIAISAGLVPVRTSPPIATCTCK